MDYLMLIGGWLVYFMLHSVLATVSVKQAANKLLGKAFRFYRLFYSLVSILGLGALMWFANALSFETFFEFKGAVRVLGMVSTTFGVILIQVSFREYSMKSFVGLADEEAVFIQNGILRWIRHPIYAGIILLTFGYFLYLPTLPNGISSACILIYLPVGIYLEEKKLVEAFGQAYIDYKMEVPALIPRWSKIFGR